MGWVAPEIVYVVDEEAVRQTVIALETYEARLSLWQNAYDELSASSEEYARDMETRWRKALSDLSALEARHKKELRRALS